MSSQELPLDEFLESFKNVPRFAISLLIINSSNDFLLTRRNIQPEMGKWHLPGGFLLKNETFTDCITRILDKEIGIRLSVAPTLLFVSEDLDKDPRGHVVESIYKAQIS